MLFVKCDECDSTFPEGTVLIEIVKIRGGDTCHDRVCQLCHTRMMNENSDNANILLG